MDKRPTLSELAAQSQDGWDCPRCGCRDWRVNSTWHTRAGIRRQRVCRNCGHGVMLTTEAPQAKITPANGNNRKFG